MLRTNQTITVYLRSLDCERIFNDEQALFHHINIDHEGVKCDCNHCNYQAILQGNLTKHLQLKHKGVKYACNQCDKKFTQQITLTRHIHSIHEGVKYTCDQCGKQYTEEGGLRKHSESNMKDSNILVISVANNFHRRVI